MLNADRGDALSAGIIQGYSYTRLENPTTHPWERRIACLELGEEAVAIASGMAAVSCIALRIRERRSSHRIKRVVRYIHRRNGHVFPHFGVHADFADDINDFEAVESLIGSDTTSCERSW
jgi:O-acetylhomoserine (thiol)-lyase